MRTALQIAGILSAGVFLAWWRGASLADPLFVIAFACLPAILVPSIFAERRRLNPDEPELTQAGETVVQSCATVYVMLLVSLVIVGPPLTWSVALSAVLLGVAFTTVAASLSLYGLRRFSGSTMKWIARAVFLGLILVYRALPDPIDFAIERITIWGIVPVSLVAATGAAIMAALLLLLR